jgi:hypothetical protein
MRLREFWLKNQLELNQSFLDVLCVDGSSVGLSKMALVMAPTMSVVLFVIMVIFCF